jgi:hypothetical protein
MADRIERFLGRLEAELEGRVDGVRLEEILVEVEGHLRDSEEGWRELGEPDELANRLAVAGFGGHAAITERASGQVKIKPNGIKSWVWSGLIGFFWFMILVVPFGTCSTILTGFSDNMVYAVFLSLVVGWLAFKWQGLQIRVWTFALVGAIIFWQLFGTLVPPTSDNGVPKIVTSYSYSARAIDELHKRFESINDSLYSTFVSNPGLRTKLAAINMDASPGGVEIFGWESDGLYFESAASPVVKKWLKDSTGLSGRDAAVAVKWEQFRRQVSVVNEIQSRGWMSRWFAILNEVGPRFLGLIMIYACFGYVSSLLRKLLEQNLIVKIGRKIRG